MPGLERDLVFLSYAHEDLDKVRKVYEGLKERNVNVWFDKENLGPGRWKPQILKAISRSKYFAICLSNSAVKKTSGEKPGFQDKELQTAWQFAEEQDEKVFSIVPVRLEDCGRGNMMLSGWQQYDLFKDWEGVLDKLAVHLGGKSLSDATAIDERTEDEKMLESMMGKGRMFYYLGEYDRALSLFEAAISIKPDYHKAWYNKGVILVDLGRPDEAFEAYNKAIEIKPDDHEAWYNKGATLADLGRYDEALEAFNKAIEIKPDDHETWTNKGAALGSLGRYDEALEAYNKSIEIKPDDHKAWYNKGYVLYKLGRYDEALEAYNKAIEIKPDSHEAWYNLACLYSLKKEKGKALKYFQKAIENGYNDLSHIKKDSDMDFIRNEKEFQAIINKI
jgi:tetratricopeptide (TPR) repeat protein